DRSSHRLPYFLDRLGHTRTRGILAALERPRDVGVLEALHLPKHERRALSFGQHLDGLREIRERHAVAVGRRQPKVREAYQTLRAAGTIDHLVRRDAVEPCALLPTSRRRPRAERGQECLLIHVVGVIPVADKPQRVSEDLTLMALQKLAEGQQIGHGLAYRTLTPAPLWDGATVRAMDEKRAVLALMLSVIVACGGSTPAGSAGAGASAAATAGANASGGATSGGAGATTTAATTNGPKLADLLAAGKLAEYKITYMISASSG